MRTRISQASNGQILSLSECEMKFETNSKVEQDTEFMNPAYSLAGRTNMQGLILSIAHLQDYSVFASKRRIVCRLPEFRTARISEREYQGR